MRDTFDGASGIDIADYSAYSANLTIALNGGTVAIVSGSGSSAATSDTLVNVESFKGGTGVDIVTGDGNDNTYVASVDNVQDTFDGAGGSDTVDYSAYTANLALTLNGAVSTTVNGSGAVADSIVNVENFIGGSGNDFFHGDANNNVFNGSGGTDQISYQGVTTAISVNLAAGTVIGDVSVGTDTLRSVEFLGGTAGDDTYNSGGFSSSSTNAGSNGTFNAFIGMGGDDTITGNGNTQVQYFNATSGVSITLGTNGSGSSTGDASVGHDTFVSGVNNVLGSNSGDNYDASAFTSANGTFNQFQGYGGDDTITGNGNTQLYYAGASEAIAATLNAGGSGSVAGGLSGGTDTILSGVSSIVGSNLSDTITLNSPGASFQSSLTGGGGNDTFAFKTNSGQATITDFQIGLDQIELDGLFTGTSDPAFTSFLANLQSAANGVHDIDLTGTTITLTNVNVSQLQVSDFVIHL